MQKVTVIKKDATTDITIGTGFLGALQKLLYFILADKTEEELSKYKEEVEKHKTVQETCSQEWMDHVKVLSVFISSVEKKMIDENKTEEKEMLDTIQPEN
jgi:hypothetical protein